MARRFPEEGVIWNHGFGTNLDGKAKTKVFQGPYLITTEEPPKCERGRMRKPMMDIVRPASITPPLHTLYAINAMCLSSLGSTISIHTTEQSILGEDVLLYLLSDLQNLINHLFFHIGPA
jgi:hypothetical protein